MFKQSEVWIEDVEEKKKLTEAYKSNLGYVLNVL